ncbi:MAG TPA: FosX/FosE/FosI family fosfomycin resistance thiol transferase [Rhizobiales bacterium]|nr:FosX/FosE/FosI family fosfomycin resistance thiol transferase [Hyphomicrobiales bacterium]
MVSALSHITFVVEDLNRMSGFLTHIFDAREVYSSGDNTFSVSSEKFFIIGEQWIAIMQGTPMPERSYNHVAFKIDDKEFDLYQQRLEDYGAEMLSGRPRVKGEGRSLYFYDHDNHLFELHTGTLEQRLARYQAETA